LLHRCRSSFCILAMTTFSSISIASGAKWYGISCPFPSSDLWMTGFIFALTLSLIRECSDDPRRYHWRIGLARWFPAAPMPILTRQPSIFPAILTPTFPIPICFHMAHGFLLLQRLRG
jgi:hypothetical protein